MTPTGNPEGPPLTVRAASLENYVAVAGAIGLDGAEMLRKFGIDPQWLEDSQYKIPASAVSTLITESAAQSGCETVGLLLAENRQFSSFGPLSLLLRHERTLRAVLGRLMEYQRLLSEVAGYSLEEDAEEARIIVQVAPGVASRQSTEMVMALTSYALGGAIFGGWYPREVHFQHRAPLDARVHQRTFRAPLRFDATFNGFVIPSAALDRANAYRDDGLVVHAQHFVDLLSQELPEQSLGPQVRAVIMRLLAGGGATLPRVARELAVHPRTLQRKLAAEALSFADLAESARTVLACDLLAEGDLTIAEIASRVGYGSPATFSRWFSQMAGQAPLRWRMRNGKGRSP